MHCFKYAIVVKDPNSGWEVLNSDLIGAENLEHAKIKASKHVPEEKLNDVTLEVLVAPFV